MSVINVMIETQDGTTVTASTAVETINLTVNDVARNIELQSANGYIQWRLIGNSEWINLVALSTLLGPAPQFQKTSTAIQWKTTADSVWVDLIQLSELKGADGHDGQDGASGSGMFLKYTYTAIGGETMFPVNNIGIAIFTMVLQGGFPLQEAGTIDDLQSGFYFIDTETNYIHLYDELAPNERAFIVYSTP